MATAGRGSLSSSPQKNAAHDRELFKAFSKLDYRVYRGSIGGFPVSAGFWKLLLFFQCGLLGDAGVGDAILYFRPPLDPGNQKLSFTIDHVSFSHEVHQDDNDRCGNDNG
jgi:hypothetical protein